MKVEAVSTVERCEIYTRPLTTAPLLNFEEDGRARVHMVGYALIPREYIPRWCEFFIWLRYHRDFARHAAMQPNGEPYQSWPLAIWRYRIWRPLLSRLRRVW